MKIMKKIEIEDCTFNFRLGEHDANVIFGGAAATEPWPPRIDALYAEAEEQFITFMAEILQLVEFTEDDHRTIPTSLEHRKAIAREHWNHPEKIV